MSARSRVARWLCALALAGAFAPVGFGQEVRVDRVQIGLDGHFRPGAWAPVRLEVTAGSGGAGASVDVRVNDRLALRFDVNLPAGGGATLAGLLWLADAEDVVRVGAAPPLTLQAVPATTPLIVLQTELPAALDAAFPSACVARIDVARLAVRDGAFDAADALVLDPRTRATLDLDDRVRRVLAGFVAGGGRILDAGALPADRPTPRARPVPPTAAAFDCFPPEPWSGGRAAALLTFLPWVALAAAVVAGLARLRPGPPAHGLRLALVAATLLLALWFRLEPPAPSGTRALRRLRPEGSEMWVAQSGAGTVRWSVPGSAAVPFRVLFRDPAAARRLQAWCSIAAGRETWHVAGLDSGDLVLHYRATAADAVSAVPVGSPMLVWDAQGARWLGGAAEPAPAAPVLSLAALAARHFPDDAARLTARIARLALAVDGLDPGRRWRLRLDRDVDADGLEWQETWCAEPVE